MAVKLFGDNEKTWELARWLLEMFSLSDLLDMNDVTEEELVVKLLEDGIIAEPRSVIESYEEDATEAD